jgi:hypothetical protein
MRNKIKDKMSPKPKQPPSVAKAKVEKPEELIKVEPS